MKKLSIILAVISCTAAMAQEGVKDVVPANPEGKQFTMEDVILKRAGYPSFKLISNKLKELKDKGISFNSDDKPV